MNEYSGVLHVYSQEYEHGEALIAGTPDVLLRLAQVCQFLAEHPEEAEQQILTFAGDGKPYCVLVQARTEDALSKVMVLPYASPNSEE